MPIVPEVGMEVPNESSIISEHMDNLIADIQRNRLRYDINSLAKKLQSINKYEIFLVVE
jgi:hypothetical protein